jgi:membrane peptidoglycan carboxypeptidase
VLSARAAAQLARMMAAVFDRGKEAGTAHDIVLPGFTAAGKTGTAHKIDPGSGRYAEHLYLSSFGGFAPLEEPRIAVLVLIDEPAGEEHYGAQVAGPPWLEVTVETLRYLGIPAGASAPAAAAAGPSAAAAGPSAAGPSAAGPSAAGPSAAGPSAAGSSPTAAGVEAAATESDSVRASEPPTSSEAAVGEGAPAQGDETGDVVDVPDLAGLGLADALEVAATRCHAVEVRGSGRVIEQFPSPGRRRRPAECRIVLSHESGPRPRSPR